MVVATRAAFAEESAEVEVLFANLDKMKSLTKKIQSSMNHLETTGKTVEEAIGPIYGNTQRLQTTNSNIDRIIMAIDRIREPLDMRNQEDRIIRSSPQQVGLNDYISSIDRTRQAVRNLKQSNLRSNQQAIADLNSLLMVGSQQLESVFGSTLREGVQTAEPLHFVAKGIGFPRLPSSKTAQLRTINGHIMSTISELAPISPGTSPSAKIYAEIRGQHITSSLQNMSAACIATARKQNPGSLYKRGDNAVATYASAVQGMYLAEYENIGSIFQRDECGQIFTNTCQSSLDVFASTLRDLDRHIKDNLVSDCYLAYEIIEVVSATSSDVGSRTGELKAALSDALKPVRETAKSSLSFLLTDVRTRSQGFTQFAQDGAPVPLTTEVMTRLQTMTGFLVPVSSLLTSLGDGGWMSAAPTGSGNSTPTLASFDVGADGTKLFSHYASDMIETLLANLDARSRTFLRTPAVQAVFLANNVAIVERMIRSSDLAPLLSSAQPRIEAWRVKASKAYQNTWNDVSRYLFDVQYTNRGPRPPSTGTAVESAAYVKALSSKDKDATKEKFKNFNTAFDELVAKHKSFRMEREVKAAFATNIAGLIEPLYVRLWDRYHEIDKGKGKYVKYDKAQLNAVLAGLA